MVPVLLMPRSSQPSEGKHISNQINIAQDHTILEWQSILPGDCRRCHKGKRDLSERLRGKEEPSRILKAEGMAETKSKGRVGG